MKRMGWIIMPITVPCPKSCEECMSTLFPRPARLPCHNENGLADNTLVIFTSDNGGMFNIGGQDAFVAGLEIGTRGICSR